MNSRLLAVIFCLMLTAMPATPATIIYSDIQDIPIPLDAEGAYLQIDTGATTAAFPANWATAPWINPFFAGVYIGNSPLLRPVVTGPDQILNLGLGTHINSASNFVAGESGSSTHVGTGPGQFAMNVPGYLGVAFRTSAGGPEYYGWIQVQISNTGPGKIISWAHETVSGQPIQVGTVPEPGTALLCLVGSGLALLQRRRA